MDLLNKFNKKKREDTRKEIIKAYRDAILLAGRSGFIHDQAFANERMAEYFVEQCKQLRHGKNVKDADTTIRGGDVSSNGSTLGRQTQLDNVGDDENIEEAMYRFGQAKRLYKEWGADAVVERIERRCRMLIDEKLNSNSQCH